MGRRAFGAMLITAPSESERIYEMAVRLVRAELKPMPHCEARPWMRLRANIETGAVFLATGVTVKYREKGP